MDVLVTHVYDKLRFAYYFALKFEAYDFYKHQLYGVAEAINLGKYLKLTDLPECDVRYLQRPNLQYTEHFCAINKPICDLKILNNNDMSNRPSISPHYEDKVRRLKAKKELDDERKSSETIDITPCDNESQSSSFELYSVTYTKVIENKEALNIHQITALLNDPNVKSINIKK